MDCRETQTLLAAFHDGELPAADRARVEEHLRGCPECAARLADLVRVDQAAGVPDPGRAYWDRFNARVMDRVEREADGPRVAVLRPKGGWMRQQLRYLIPAAAAAALVVVVVRFGGMNPGAPTPTVPTAVSERAPPDPAGERRAKAEPESRATERTENGVVARPVPPPVLAKERLATVTREERDRLADRSMPAGNEEASRDRAAALAAKSVPSPSPLMAEQQGAGKAKSASSPCELVRTLAERERFREAEAAQRACLAGDLAAPTREKGLVFLAELLDRQARFADADVVIAEVDRQYPQSRPLDLYRQRRSMVQKQPAAVPVTR